MARQENANYQADLDTQFEWATNDNDPFDRELDMMRVAVALDEHTHADGRGLPVARLATNAVDAASINSNAVTTAKIADGQITLAKMATGSVNAAAIVDGTITNTELAAGVALANLGFTPINKAGDTGVGSLTMAASTTISIPSTSTISGAGYITLNRATAGVAASLTHTLADTTILNLHNSGASPGYSLGILNAAGSAWDLLISHVSASFGVAVGATTFSSNVATGTAPISVSSTTVCPNLNAQYLNGQAGSYYGRATHEVPNTLRAFFPSAASIATGWTRDTNGNGRLIMGAGTSFSVTFGEAAQGGGNWTHSHDLSSHQHSGNDHYHSNGAGGGGLGSGSILTGNPTHTALGGTPSNNNTSTHNYASTLPSYALVLAYKNG